MRTQLLLAALSVGLVSLCGTAADARPQQPDHGRVVRFHDHDSPGWRHDGGWKFVFRFGPPIVEYLPSPPVVQYVPALPTRLAVIDQELNTDDVRINVGFSRGELTGASYGKLKSEENGIRGTANRIANAFGGAIPNPQFAALQSQIQALGGDIYQLSGGAA